jgi:hypothetical protein
LPLTEEQEALVYGHVYESARQQMNLIKQAIEHQIGKGFSSTEECVKWTHEHLLDILVYSQTHKSDFYVSYTGDIITKGTWKNRYKDLMFIKYTGEDGAIIKRPWIPEGTLVSMNLRINGEHANKEHAPLYHRDYFTPAGYYDPIRGTFNIAHPFETYAEDTGTDVSYFFTYIEHLGGKYAPWLLAWLRAKLLNPNRKTEVVPIIISRTQGNGKTTFAEVICKALFEPDNVLVTDQYDSNAKFNADYADTLIVCNEEKDEADRRSTTASIKSRSTATHIRKENKGMDPIYQEDYSELILTSNKDIPIKFEDSSRQRRFMVVEADSNFTRKNILADQVFNKLYGFDVNDKEVDIPLIKNKKAKAQIKHELLTRKDIEEVPLKDFPDNTAAKRMFNMARTVEAVDIDSIMRAIAPFVKDTLDKKYVVDQRKSENGDNVSLLTIISNINAINYVPEIAGYPAFVALCRPIIFYDSTTGKQFAHATVERTLYDCNIWLEEEYGLTILPNMLPLAGGFKGIYGRYSMAPCARIVKKENVIRKVEVSEKQTVILASTNTERIGNRLRINSLWKPDPKGEFETVNEMKPGTIDLSNKNANVQYMDTFLFESDDTTEEVMQIEEGRIEAWKKIHDELPMSAQKLFDNRLRLQKAEAQRLFNEGIIARVVYSGSKSYHLIVRVVDEPDTLEQYVWLHGHLCNILSDKINFDPSTSDPARLTRAPILFERLTDYHGIKVKGTQGPLHTNWSNVYNYSWRPLYQQWLNRPKEDYEQSRRLIPTKPEYREAMLALLHGTFWTDSTWNGRRNRVFWSAYRLCRWLGFEHDILWTDSGILDGLNNYSKKNEIQYWRSREHADIIQNIDRDMDRILEGIANGE